MGGIFSKELATSRQELILFAEAVKINKIAKAEGVNKDAVTKCGLFVRLAAGPRQYWLRHIASYIVPNRILLADIINTKTYYHSDSSQVLIERKFIVVFLDFHQSTQTVIKGKVEVSAKKNGERNINHNNHTFYCSTISYEEAKFYYMIRLKKYINYSIQLTESDTYPDIIATALGNYIAQNDPGIILGELPPLVC